MAQILAWRSILDILLIAAGLFFLYRTVIRLGTWKIVAGILLAAVFFVVASYIDLRGIEWIYRNVSHVAVISIVILFQPELRKLFERAALMKRSRAVRYDEQFSRIIAESMWELALKRVGAIIVIPGREEIGEWLNGGYPLNALPSVPLILSIFDPNSPGHDGALVVQNDKFSMFGVRLPVSHSGRLGEDYGTRHQASMGLSEKADALVITVSEERGRVSLFHNGVMRVMAGPDDIVNSICSHCGEAGLFQPAIPAKKISRAMALEILGSLAVTLVLWTALISSQGEMLEKSITVPVEYTATAEDVVMTGEKANEVRLQLSGSKADLDAVASSALSVKIDLSKAVEGKQTVLISSNNIRLPKGVNLLDVAPSKVDITISKRIRKDVEITPQLVGKLPEGIAFVSVEVSPRTLAALLPSDDSGDTLKSVTTTPVYLEGIRDDTKLFCKIIAPPSIQPVEKRWPDVEVIITVKRLE